MENKKKLAKGNKTKEGLTGGAEPQVSVHAGSCHGGSCMALFLMVGSALVGFTALMPLEVAGLVAVLRGLLVLLAA